MVGSVHQVTAPQNEIDTSLALSNFEAFWTHYQTPIKGTSVPEHLLCEPQGQLKNQHVKTKDRSLWPLFFSQF